MSQKPLSSKVPAKFFHEFFAHSLNDPLANLYLHPYTLDEYQEMYESKMATFHLNTVTTLGGTEKVIGFVVKKLGDNTYSGISLFGQTIDKFPKDLITKINLLKEEGAVQHIDLQTIDLSVIDFFMLNVYIESKLIKSNGKIDPNITVVGDCFGDFLSSGYNNKGWETTETFGFAKQFLSPEARISYRELRRIKAINGIKSALPTIGEAKEFIRTFHQKELSYHELKSNPHSQKIKEFSKRFFNSDEKTNPKKTITTTKK